MNNTTGPPKHPILRVVLDECVGPDSLLVQQFKGSLQAEQQVEFILLAKDHRAIPDSRILSRLLGPGTVLLTTDRVLHNQACDLGFRSYTLNTRGELIRKKLPAVPTPRPILVSGGHGALYAGQPGH